MRASLSIALLSVAIAAAPAETSAAPTMRDRLTQRTVPELAPVPRFESQRDPSPDAASPFQDLYDFKPGTDGTTPPKGFVDVNGTLYGVTVDGGAYNQGTVVAINRLTGAERIVYTFTGRNDGGHPFGELILFNGFLCGTTNSGGLATSGGSAGTVFEVSLTGSERTLHNFSGQGTDGASPNAGLIDRNGVLYGTTYGGGVKNAGVVYELSATGAYHALYQFTGGKDGGAPTDGLVDLNGLLYGTTHLGGAHGEGTVFSLTAAGKESVLHSFAGGADGAFPYAGLLAVNRVLYGTTFGSGANGTAGGGTVFEITPAGVETVLHAFTGGVDGYQPFSGLAAGGSLLYGTTVGGGRYGEGTAYGIAGNGKVTILHNFGSGALDGASPTAPLLVFGSILYGFTQGGGTYGLGTAFALTTAGAEKILHSFAPGTDGNSPIAGLVEFGGDLYGDTPGGGSDNLGTIFELAGPGKDRIVHTFTGSADGAVPFYAGLLFGAGSVAYGTTGAGGKYGAGTVFSYSRTSGKEQVLYNFTGRSDGGHPSAGLTELGGDFYGVTDSGGKYGGGVVFSLTAAGKETVLHSFGNGTDGKYPEAALIAVGGNLYGTTEQGGPSQVGTIFEIARSGGYRVLINFAGVDGSYPDSSLLYVSGVFYGTTDFGGITGNGNVFEYCASCANHLTGLHDFTGGIGDGAVPVCGLTAVGADLYGTTLQGGSSSQGTIFEYSISSKAEKAIYSFGSSRGGEAPNAPLVYYAGKLYGTAQQGGAYGLGSVFAWTL